MVVQKPIKASVYVHWLIIYLRLNNTIVIVYEWILVQLVMPIESSLLRLIEMVDRVVILLRWGEVWILLLFGCWYLFLFIVWFTFLFLSNSIDHVLVLLHQSTVVVKVPTLVGFRSDLSQLSFASFFLFSAQSTRIWGVYYLLDIHWRILFRAQLRKMLPFI